MRSVINTLPPFPISPKPTSSSYLEYTCAIGRSPGIQQVILARTDEPLSAISELERQHAALVQMQLVFVGFAVVQYLYVAALHTMRG